MPKLHEDARADRLLRIVDVAALCSLSKSEIYKRVKRDEFPRAVSIGPRAVRWKQSAIHLWIASRTIAPEREAVPASTKRGRPRKLPQAGSANAAETPHAEPVA